MHLLPFSKFENVIAEYVLEIFQDTINKFDEEDVENWNQDEKHLLAFASDMKLGGCLTSLYVKNHKVGSLNPFIH